VLGSKLGLGAFALHKTIIYNNSMHVMNREIIPSMKKRV